jgi:hypothetical protein
MDFIVQLPKTENGWDAVLVCVDRLTKRAHFVPTLTTATAPDTAELFLNTVIKHHGLPKVLITDRDSKFISLFWKSLFQRLGTKLAFSSAYHPQTDGQTERLNRILQDMLRNYVDYHQKNWDSLLPLVEIAYNNAEQSSIGLSPFYFDTGRHPYLPGNLLVNPESTRSQVEEVDQFLLRQEQSLAQVREHLKKAQDRQAKYANQHRRPTPDFTIGQLVLLNQRNLVNPPDQNRPKKKLLSKFIGPFKVTKKISPVAYQLELPPKFRIHNVFHISLLKPYHPNPSEFPGRVTLPPTPIKIEGRQEEWEVEKILDKRERYKKVQYLVKWKGFPLYDSSWESASNLANAPASIAKFEGKKH